MSVVDPADEEALPKLEAILRGSADATATGIGSIPVPTSCTALIKVWDADWASLKLRRAAIDNSGTTSMPSSPRSCRATRSEALAQTRWRVDTFLSRLAGRSGSATEVVSCLQ